MFLSAYQIHHITTKRGTSTGRNLSYELYLSCNSGLVTWLQRRPKKGGGLRVCMLSSSVWTNRGYSSYVTDAEGFSCFHPALLSVCVASPLLTKLLGYISSAALVQNAIISCDSSTTRCHAFFDALQFRLKSCWYQIIRTPGLILNSKNKQGIISKL